MLGHETRAFFSPRQEWWLGAFTPTGPTIATDPTIAIGPTIATAVALPEPGIARVPNRFLRAGDSLEIEVETLGMGILRNPCIQPVYP